MHNHFNRINKEYFINLGDKKEIYHEINKLINPLIKNKIILDIGSGGHVFYNHDLSKKIYVLDVSTEMLNSLDNNKIIKINQDARNMNKIPDNSIDVILIIFALHHINGKNYNEAITSLRKIMLESNKKLNNSGELFIIEPVLNKFFFFIEKLFYKFTFFVLEKLKTDMVFFYSEKILRKNILDFYDKQTLKILKIKTSGWLDPLLGTFPGLIKIPAFLMPTKMKCFIIKKFK
tara:strand:- start:31638 stop:32336 length:699 start_codon:yes stop_codon:yes gene_type:complete